MYYYLLPSGATINEKMKIFTVTTEQILYTLFYVVVHRQSPIANLQCLYKENILLIEFSIFWYLYELPFFFNLKLISDFQFFNLATPTPNPTPGF